MSEKNLVEVQIQMLKAELRMSQQVTNRVGDPNRRTLQQTQFIPCRSLRPNSRMGRDEYLSTFVCSHLIRNESLYLFIFFEKKAENRKKE